MDNLEKHKFVWEIFCRARNIQIQFKNKDYDSDLTIHFYDCIEQICYQHNLKNIGDEHILLIRGFLKDMINVLSEKDKLIYTESVKWFNEDKGN